MTSVSKSQNDMAQYFSSFLAGFFFPLGGQQNEIALTSVEEIKLYYVTSGQGAVCGINIVDSGANNKYGCNTNKVSFPMENNFAFAGFSALQQASGDGAIILYPLQYRELTHILKNARVGKAGQPYFLAWSSSLMA